MSVVKSYIKETLARLTGDQDTVIAEKNFRKNSAAVRGQIAALEAQLVNAEDGLDTAKEALMTTKYPTTLSTGGQSYISAIARANEAVELKQAEVDQIKASIKFNQDLLEEFNKEVEG